MPQADSKSSSGQEQQQADQSIPYPIPYHQQFEDDTINLYELWITLLSWKWLVIAVTVVAALGSVVYTLQLKHVYKAQALLLPPKEKDIQSINVAGLSYNPTVVFKEFKQNLKSRNLQKKFIHEKGMMELLAPDRTPETRDVDIYKGFAGLFKLREINGLTSLAIEMDDPEIASQLVNDVINFFDKETIAMLVEDSQNTITKKIRSIEYEIASKRQMAKKRREDQIVRYNEAAKIASNLGIKRRVDATNIIQNTQMNVDIATATTPLYYLGLEALSTEIYILKNRKSDDPFIGGLRDLQEKLALLRSIDFSIEKMHAVQIDQAAYPPNNPIKPNRRSIVSLATVVGLFSGVFLAFFIEFVKNQRKKHSE